MPSDVIYHYKKDRKKQSLLYIRMAVACLLYIAGLYGYEWLMDDLVSTEFKLQWILIFLLASLVLFAVAWWHRRNPATYEATITRERFVVDYPSYPDWSFDISIADIERFEYRQSIGQAGRGVLQHGVLLKNGDFHHISMNYGNSLNKMYKAIQSINPEITFPSKTKLNTYS